MKLLTVILMYRVDLFKTKQHDIKCKEKRKLGKQSEPQMGFELSLRFSLHLMLLFRL